MDDFIQALDFVLNFCTFIAFGSISKRSGSGILGSFTIDSSLPITPDAPLMAVPALPVTPDAPLMAVPAMPVAPD